MVEIGKDGDRAPAVESPGIGGSRIFLPQFSVVEQVLDCLRKLLGILWRSGKSAAFDFDGEVGARGGRPHYGFAATTPVHRRYAAHIFSNLSAMTSMSNARSA